MRKLLAFVLCMALLLTPILAGCNDNSGETSKDGSQAEANSNVSDAVSDDGVYTPNLPEYKWESGKEFRVCVYSNNIQTTYFSEEIEPDMYSTTDQALSEAVRNRNNNLGERYKDVKIIAVAVDNVISALEADKLGDDGLYDAAMPFIGGAITQAQKHMYLDLLDYNDYIDFSKPWWDQNFQDTMTVGNHVYFAVGDISIMQKIVSSSVIFNKELLSQIDPDADLYQDVRDGKWTLDRMYELGKAATKELNGDETLDYHDQWGLYSSYGVPSGFYIAAGQNYVVKDGNGLPVLRFGKGETISAAQSVLEKFTESGTWVEYVERSGLTGAEMWKLSVDVFGENRALFYGCAFSAIKKLRAYKELSPFGFLPLPKLNEEQDGYHTPCAGVYAYAVVIPTTAPDPKFSAFMVEAMCAEAKNTIVPAYYDVTLKVRDAKDDESEEMLDKYIFANITYDLGLLYPFGGLNSLLENLVKKGSTAVGSEFETISGNVESDIEKLIDFYEND